MISLDVAEDMFGEDADVIPASSQEVLMTWAAYRRHEKRMGVPPAMVSPVGDKRIYVNNQVLLMRDMVPAVATELNFANQARANSVAASMVMQASALKRTSVDAASLSTPETLPRTFTRRGPQSRRSLPRSSICMGPNVAHHIVSSTLEWDRGATMAGNPREIVSASMINIASQRRGVYTMDEDAAHRATSDMYVRLETRFPAFVGSVPGTHNSSMVYPSENIITTGPEQLPGINRVMDITHNRFKQHINGINPRLFAFGVTQGRNTYVVSTDVPRARREPTPEPMFGGKPMSRPPKPAIGRPENCITFLDTEIARLPGDTPTLEQRDVDTWLYTAPIPGPSKEVAAVAAAAWAREQKEMTAVRGKARQPSRRRKRAVGRKPRAKRVRAQL